MLKGSSLNPKKLLYMTKPLSASISTDSTDFRYSIVCRRMVFYTVKRVYPELLQKTVKPREDQCGFIWLAAPSVTGC